MEIKDALRIKKDIQRRLPRFTRQCSHKKKRLGPGWRKPKGMHSKMRRQLRSRKRIVKIGYGTPRILKGFNRLGLKEKIINCLKDIEELDNKTECAVIASGVGLKNKIELVKEAIQKNIIIINVKKPEEFVKKAEEERKEKKEESKEKKKAKEEKKKEREKKAEEKKKKEEKKEEKDELNEEEMKEQEKKEMDKALTKKE